MSRRNVFIISAALLVGTIVGGLLGVHYSPKTVPASTPAEHHKLGAAVGIPTISEVVSSNSAVNVLNYGAKGDARYFTDGVANGTTTFTSATANFTSADQGKTITIQGGGDVSGVSTRTISSVTNSTTITLSSALSTTTTDLYCALGTENTSALQTALNACASVSTTYTNTAITTATATLTVTGGSLSFNDVGSFVKVAGAGASGADLYAYITAVSSATSCTLSANAGTSVSGVTSVVMKSGGQCLLPAGNYLCTGNLYVPPGVTLQGTFQSPPTFYGPNVGGSTALPRSGGSIFYVCGGSGSSSGTPFINLNQHSTCRGLAFFYPNQPVLGASASAPLQYPFTIQFLPGTSPAYGADAKVENCTFVNAYQGITSANHQRPVIRNVFGQAYLTGITIDSCYDAGSLENINWTIDWDLNGSSPPTFQSSNMQAYVLARVDEMRLSKCFCYGANQAFVFNQSSVLGAGNSPWAIVTECGADVCAYGCVINQSASTPPGFGLRFVGCEFTSCSTSPVTVASSHTGSASFSNCVFHSTSTAIAGSGDVSLDGCRFVAGGITITATGNTKIRNSHLTAGTITTSGGKVRIAGNDLIGGGASVISINAGTTGAIVVDNNLGPSGTINNGIGASLTQANNPAF